MKKIAQNSLLVLASVFFFFLALELILRSVDQIPLLKFENFISARTDLVTREAGNLFDPQLGWVGTQVFVKPGAEPDSVKGAIVAIGDSFTAGSYVPTDQNWPAQLERKVGERVINAAVGGYALDQIVLRAEALLEALQPRLVIIAIVADDIARNGFQTYGGGNKPYFLIKDGKLVPMNRPVPRFNESRDLGPALAVLGYLYFVDWSLRRAGYSQLEYGLKYRRVDTDEGEVSCLLLKGLQQETEKRGIKLLILLQYGGLGAFAYKTRAEYPPYMEKTLRCIREYGIETVDQWPDFKQILEAGLENFKSLWIMRPGMQEGGYLTGGWYFDHPSIAGHELTARRVAERLDQLGWATYREKHFER
jgi:lysophospholipase L1-like esterase